MKKQALLTLIALCTLLNISAYMMQNNQENGPRTDNVEEQAEQKMTPDEQQRRPMMGSMMGGRMGPMGQAMICPMMERTENIEKMMQQMMKRIEALEQK